MTGEPEFTITPEPEEEDLTPVSKADRDAADKAASVTVKNETLRQKTERRRLSPTSPLKNIDIVFYIVMGVCIGASITLSFLEHYKCAIALAVGAMSAFPACLLAPKGDFSKWFKLLLQHVAEKVFRAWIEKSKTDKKADREDESLFLSIYRKIQSR